MANSPQYQKTGSFVATTQIWGQESDRQLLIRLHQAINLIALVLNTKSTGAYYLQEFVTGDLFFPNPNATSNSSAPYPLERQVSRSVVNFGALPSGAPATKSVPHNLNPSAQWTFTKIYGCSTNPTLFTDPPTMFGAVPTGMNYIPLPYVSVRDATGSLELSVDQVNVNITTAGTNYSNWTMTYLVLEWITL